MDVHTCPDYRVGAQGETIPKPGSQGYMDVKTTHDATYDQVRHSHAGRDPEEVTISPQTDYGWLDGNDKKNGFPYNFSLDKCGR